MPATGRRDRGHSPMSNLSESSGATSRHTSSRRYWQRTSSPRPWWPWGLLPVLGLFALFLIGALITAPNIQAEVRSEVADRFAGSEVVATVVRGDGQGINIRAVAPIEEMTYLHALAKSTQCDTWAGQLTCPTTVSVLLSEPQIAAAAPAPRPLAVPAAAVVPAAVENQAMDQGPDCNDQFNDILSNTKVRFATGSATIDRGNEDLLQRLARTARSCSGDLVVVGHTDSRGAADANQVLSLARAQAVADALAQLGIESNRVSARGVGESNPIAENDTPEGRARNRRIVITVDQQN